MRVFLVAAASLVVAAVASESRMRGSETAKASQLGAQAAQEASLLQQQATAGTKAQWRFGGNFQPQVRARCLEKVF